MGITVDPVSYKITNRQYPYAMQDGTSGLKFLMSVLGAEGAELAVFDGRLIAYDVQLSEAEPPRRSIDLSDSDYELITKNKLGAVECVIGKWSARAQNGEGATLRITSLPVAAWSDLDCARWAQNFMRAQERESVCLSARIDLSTAIFPATALLVQLPTEMKMFVKHIRHDYINGITKLFLRGIPSD
jgi:hypothetical protein